MNSQFIVIDGRRSNKQKKGSNCKIESKSNIVSERHLQQSQQSTIQPQPKPFEPYAFNTLSLISSLVQPKPQSVLSQIQLKKQKYYNEKLKQSSINRQKFMSRIIQITQNKKSPHYNNHNITQEKILSEQNKYSHSDQSDSTSSRRVSLTFSGQHDDIQSITNHQNDNNKIVLLTTNKRQLSVIKMVQSVNAIHQQSTKIQQKEHKKKKVKIIKINKNNNQCNRMTETNQLQQSSTSVQQQTDNNNSSNGNNSEFMFLTQYQKDQKQIMNRLLNIIEKEIQFNSNNINNNTNNQNKQSDTINIDRILMSRQLTIKQLQQNRRSKSRKIYKQYKNNNHNDSIYPHINNSLMENNYNKIYTKSNQFKPQNRRDSVPLIQCEVNQNNEQKINFQLLYQHFKQQQQQSITQKQQVKQNTYQNNPNTININPNTSMQQHSQSQTISNIPYSPRQLSSINPSHLTSANLTLINYCNSQSEVKLPQKSTLQQQQQLLMMKQIEKQDRKRDHCEKKWQKKKLSYQESSKLQVISTSNQLNQTDNPTKQSQQQINQQQQQTVNNKKKQSVLMEIPLDNDGLVQLNKNKKQNISLADAFKKKFGATRVQGKSQSKRILNNNKNNENERIGQDLKSELKQQQNHITNNSFTQNKEINCQQGKSITVKFNNINIHNKQNKQNTNSFQQTPRTQSKNLPSKSNTKSVTSNNKNNNSNNKTPAIKEPPKQLIDRLIYGKKVNMTKKDMYELSKKNYMKLPEVQERKRLQEKRQKQIQRLEKIKEYQKRIRASKVNCAASINNNSQQSSSTTSIMQ